MRNITHKLLHLSRQDIILALLTLACSCLIFIHLYTSECQNIKASKFTLECKWDESGKFYSAK